jgi:hypothetical protein
LISEEMSGLPFHENSSKKQMILFLAILWKQVWRGKRMLISIEYYHNI